MSDDIRRLKDSFNHIFSNFVHAAWLDSSSSLHKAIKYCLDGDGKRVRALLSMMVCESYGKEPRRAVSAAVAVEMVHAYSLAHDDLPCMDNDDWRRGIPSLHKAFGEATALLAGDAILTDSMRVLADASFFPDTLMIADGDRVRLIRELAMAAGGHGMVYGQDLDMFWTGRGNVNKYTLDSIHKGKTGALIGASCAMGAISAGASEEDVLAWRRFGVLIGLAFQAIDDTLDQTKSTGKSAGKDEAQGKLTYLSLHNNDEIRGMAEAYTAEALSLIPKELNSDNLSRYVKELVFRKK